MAAAAAAAALSYVNAPDSHKHTKAIVDGATDVVKSWHQQMTKPIDKANAGGKCTCMAIGSRCAHCNSVETDAMTRSNSSENLYKLAQQSINKGNDTAVYFDGCGAGTMVSRANK
eukprot:TRINITY_DN42075_c0_g1_i1.p1 TRINITY_DN42075_c0_g1~~TRINITY_DN42075_c0_g1_i1.p1  ORF type:complete len:115 (-),score=17.94 TRINITY_DN42075_c0_g1_i1:168-512(-)